MINIYIYYKDKIYDFIKMFQISDLIDQFFY